MPGYDKKFCPDQQEREDGRETLRDGVIRKMVHGGLSQQSQHLL